MNGPDSQIHVAPVAVRDPHAQELLSALTDELARGGYAENQTFGYSTDQLERAAVHLVGARVENVLLGVAGVELTDRTGELKRFYVRPEYRGSGVADALIDALLRHADANGIGVLRLETGDKQHAAISFYRRHGFIEVPRFGPYIDSATSVCMQRSIVCDVQES